MTEKRRPGGLGRGLSALMAEVNLTADAAGAPRPAARSELRVPIEKLIPNPSQPRRDFPAEAQAELAASIREKGVIQPLIVRAHPSVEGSYEIVAGERRWRAAQLAGLHELPVLVRSLSDPEVLEVAIIENVQRAGLNAIEEAAGYQQLIDRFGHTQEKLAEALGKSRSHIANLLRLLTLPPEVQDWVREGRLSAGHARALITSADPTGLARQVMARGLSVRETERLAKAPPQKPGQEARPRSAKDADTRALEQDLSATLGLTVAIDHASDGSGRVTVRYRTLEELDSLCRRLSQPEPAASD